MNVLLRRGLHFTQRTGGAKFDFQECIFVYDINRRKKMVMLPVIQQLHKLLLALLLLELPQQKLLLAITPDRDNWLTNN